MRQVLGDYNIIKQIGQGSLGMVNLAEHRFMKRQYALKVLFEEFSSDRGFIQRFEEEASRLATLDHPNIVRMHNVSFAQGQYFLVTDCVVDSLGETTNLFQYVASKGASMQEEEILDILRQVASALDYAHGLQRGNEAIIHRGLKLNNILISSENNKTKAMLSDFGLSKIVGIGTVLSRTYAALAKALELSHVIGNKAASENVPVHSIDPQKLFKLHSSFLQNYAFLAPEQKHSSGVSKDVSIKTDVYSFGVLAYYLICKEFPEGVFDFPSKLVPEYKKDWDFVIYSCLKRDPEERPSLLEEVLNNVSESSNRSFVPSSLWSPSAVLQYGRSDVSKGLGVGSIPEESLDYSEEKAVVSEREGKIFSPSTSEGAGEKRMYADGSASSGASLLCKPKEKNMTSLKPILQMQRIERPVYDPNPAKAFQVSNNVKQYHPKPQEIENIEPILTDMVIIKGGTFNRGSEDGNRDEMPKHKIHLKSFAIDVHSITNEQFVRFLEVMGGEKDCNNNDIIRLRESRIKRSGGKLSIETGYAKHPVVGVTWYGAVAYAKWLGKRLPTEAEWEAAARAGIPNNIYPFGDDIEKSQANFFSSDTTSVMSYIPNNLGIYDMSGNVYEWCQDWYGYNYYEVSAQEPDNPKGPLQGVYRVLRGGCWKSLKEDLRCAHRHRNNPGTVNRTYGFRCAADVQ